LQEPGSAEDIKKFVQGYNVQFKMMAKIDVNGKTAHPLWLYLEVLQQRLGSSACNFLRPRLA
jgi:glutathione peroxidase